MPRPTRTAVPTRPHAVVLALASLLALAACSNGGPAYTRDSELTLFHGQVKATHNSFHVRTTMGVPEWDYSMAPLDVQLASQGVRSVELDVNYDREQDRMEVFHLSLVDEGTTCRLLRDCLAAVRRWSDANPRHYPLLVQLQPRSGFDAGTEADSEHAFTRLEGELRDALGERIVTPDRVQGAATTLAAGVRAGGWPTLAESRGKVLFVFDDTEEVRRRYTRGETSLAGRLAFVDSAPGEPFAAIAILNDPVRDAAEIAAALAAGLLVRTFADGSAEASARDDRTQLAAALASGAHFLSTDFPAPFEGRPYWVSLPDATPVRCNPVTTAGRACTAADLEHPGALGR